MKVIDLIKSDLWRYAGACGSLVFVSVYLRSYGFRFQVWFRLAGALRKGGVLARVVFPFAKIMRRRYALMFGFDIPHTTIIGPGLILLHHGGVVVNPKTIIGRNCSISPGVVIGVAHGVMDKDCPEIGDGVYIGAGAKVLGKVKIGNNVVIGANAVVVHDVSDNAVVAGISAKVLSFKGAKAFIPNPCP